MSFRIVLFLPAMGLLLCGFAPAVSAQTGLLIGLRARPGPALPEAYETLWVVPVGRGVRVRRIPDLLVPTGDGFWRMGTDISCAVTDREERHRQQLENVWIKAASPPLVPRSRRDPCEDGLDDDLMSEKPRGSNGTQSGEGRSIFYGAVCYNEGNTIEFAGNGFFALSSGAEISCGVHPDALVWPSIQLLRPNSRPLPITDLLGVKGFEAFQEGIQAELRADHPPLCAADFRDRVQEGSWKVAPELWWLEHKEGAWRARGWMDTHRLCGYGFAFSIPIHLPESVVPHNLLSPDWDYLQRSIRELRDAASSPSGDMLVALTVEEFLVFLPRGIELGAPVARFRLGWNSAIVMTQWAQGGTTRLWDRRIARLAGGTAPSPSRSKPKTP